MPVVAVNIAAAVFEEVRRYVQRGLYVSPEQFLEIAAFNQVALERGVTPEEIVKTGHRKAEMRGPVVAASTPRPAPSKGGKRKTERTPPTRERTSVRTEARATEMPRLKLQAASGKLPPPVPTARRPIGERVWGQVNRLFPMKLVCRSLALAVAGKSEWPRMGDLSDPLSLEAAALGTALEEIDQRAQRKREDLLATGLPRLDNLASRDRFLSQIIARTTRASEIYPGAVCQYALADFDGDRLVLTDRGLEFARLKNPIFDEQPGAATTSLHVDERAFLRDQVVRFVPGELRDFQTVLAALKGGSTSPEQLLSATQESFPSEWSPAMLRTHISGLVSRLTELGALERSWEGRNVEYRLLDAASGLRSASASEKR